jgi:hypothetical protein
LPHFKPYPEDAMSPLIVAALVLAAPAPSEDLAAPGPKALAPYLDEKTFAVVRIDLTQLDPAALFKIVADVGGPGAADLKETEAELARWLTAFKKAGGRELDFVYTLADDHPEVFLVVPLAAKADVKTLGELLPPGLAPFGTREKVGQALIAAPEKVVERVRTMKPADRPDVLKAFDAAGPGVFQAVLLPQPHLARLIDDKEPTLPPQLGGDSLKPFTEGIQWAAISVGAPPKLGLKLTVKSPSADAAKALEGAASKLLKALAADEKALEALPGLDKAVPLLAPVVKKDGLALSLDEKQVREAFGPLLRRGVESAARMAASNSLKQLNLAAINYADTNGGTLPTVATFDKGGKPLLSWRVHLLPYLEEEKLYKEFHLDEPWDSEHNKKLIAKMPKVFRGSNSKLNEQGKTVFLAPTGKGTAWPGGAIGMKFPASFPDGTSNTILLVLADDAHAVEWTKPDDLTIDANKPHAGLGQRAGVFLLGLADGSVHFAKPTISKETLLHAFDPADGFPLGDDW